MLGCVQALLASKRGKARAANPAKTPALTDGPSASSKSKALEALGPQHTATPKRKPAQPSPAVRSGGWCNAVS